MNRKTESQLIDETVINMNLRYHVMHVLKLLTWYKPNWPIQTDWISPTR